MPCRLQLALSAQACLSEACVALPLMRGATWQCCLPWPHPPHLGSPAPPQNVSAFLLDNQLCKKDQVKVHGF